MSNLEDIYGRGKKKKVSPKATSPIQIKQQNKYFEIVVDGKPIPVPSYQYVTDLEKELKVSHKNNLNLSNTIASYKSALALMERRVDALERKLHGR